MRNFRVKNLRDKRGRNRKVLEHTTRAILGPSSGVVVGAEEGLEADGWRLACKGEEERRVKRKEDWL